MNTGNGQDVPALGLEPLLTNMCHRLVPWAFLTHNSAL